ncbi:MAG: hypothetical protein OXT71_04815 [Acidobacteriota bacterium]|nr:hypothetical protein [Acidobacteriota bacterium]
MIKLVSTIRTLMAVSSFLLAAGTILTKKGEARRVQRCRIHKMRNVPGHLPKTLHDQARPVLRAAWKLSEKDGKARIEQFAS